MSTDLSDVSVRYALQRGYRYRRSPGIPYAKYLLAAPAVIFVLIGIIYPTIYLLTNSLTAYNLARLDRPQRFIGLENYAELLTDDRFLSALWITIYFTIITTVIQTVLGLLIALALNRNVRGESAVRSFILIPWLTAPFIIGFNFRFMFAPNIGVISQLLDVLHISRLSETSILGQPATAMIAIIFVHIWSGVPGTVLLLTAGLKSIPDELYEAAAVDGATGFRKFRHITLPLLRHTLLISAFLTTLSLFKAFDLFFVMTGGGPGVTTEVLGLYQYRIGIRTLNIGYGSSIAVIQLVVSLIISVTYAWLMFRRREQ